MELVEIGTVAELRDGYSIRVTDEFKKGLTNIDGFTFLKIIWWANHSTEYSHPDNWVIDKPYTNGPDRLGVFATRSQIRPNPLCITNIIVKDIDYHRGIIYTYYIDAYPGSPILDIKPYLPACDRVLEAGIPSWCLHWPSSVEESSSFDWESEFNFSNN
ncbi:TrmO family methyltransferase domain-containing protein [Spirochaeta cellobiosiphila]|uniref:TrmO family methyltransferase domain-containing protein n=1 Tax=Spirochaeta cellobiosiphila TaxID=504483 RepID=UPI0003FF9EB5|nr:TrmO family methyltransferase [Spirochaeta cellobiosiphila]